MPPALLKWRLIYSETKGIYDMKRTVSILRWLPILAAVALVVWIFSALSHSAFQDIPLTDTGVDSHGWGGYEIRTGPGEAVAVVPRYTDDYSYELSDEGYDAVRRSRIMVEENLVESELSLLYGESGVELFLDGQLFYSDFQTALRDSNGFLLLSEEDFLRLNEFRSITVSLPAGYLGKTLTMMVYYPCADTWGVVSPPVLCSSTASLAAGFTSSVIPTLWQVFWGVMMVLAAVGCAGSMGSDSSRILRAKYILIFFMYAVSFLMRAYESPMGFYSGFTGRITKLLPQEPLGTSLMGSVLLILGTLVLLVLALCERGQKKQTIPKGWILLFGLVGFLITAMQSSTELGNGIWDYLDVLIQCMRIGNWMPTVMMASSTIMYILTLQAIVQFISQRMKEWRDQSRLLERSRFARENYEMIMQVDEDSRRRKHEMRHHMQTVYALLNAREVEKAEKYIEDMIQEADQFSESTYSENIMINSIIGFRLNQAREKGIAVCARIHVPVRLEIDDVDLSSLLSNMLENAVEACMRMEDRSGAYINLEIRKKQRFLFIECENSVDQREGLRTGWTTSKDDPAEHGFGLKAMDAIAEKYASIVQIEQEPGRFVVRTNLCLPE